ncbi:hypothetical protein Sa4125_25550 [Aureimonas sp. SA4125]|uniref:hypothetical protein n=1 Tax=Aureimonas sp. SA4125 TaxID=2826993 RepID=UPI001CC4FEE8|nr:hypothetical protein [Aureimonas sp. SA4125]BDA85013.1 hypothetical protein Sa4125_25550 [Aureimonas sp. SA4125]
MPNAIPRFATATETKPQLTMTPKLRADLRVLNEMRPIGMTRIRGEWSAQGRFLAKGRCVQLIALGYARIDYSGRHPRIKITRAGRHAIGAIGKED